MCIWRQTKTRLVQLEALLLRCCCPSAIVSSKSTRKKSLTDTKHNTRDKTTKKTDTRQTTPRRLIIHTSPTFFSLSSMQTTIRRLDESDSGLGFAFRGEHFLRKVVESVPAASASHRCASCKIFGKWGGKERMLDVLGWRGPWLRKILGHFAISTPFHGFYSAISTKWFSRPPLQPSDANPTITSKHTQQLL